MNGLFENLKYDAFYIITFVTFVIFMKILYQINKDIVSLYNSLMTIICNCLYTVCIRLLFQAKYCTILILLN